MLCIIGHGTLYHAPSFIVCLDINLSPYEKDRIIASNLGQTEMGRDMLAQGYILKQLTASLIYPEKHLGKTFWDEVYAKAQEMYGTTQIPVNTFNKVWIVADKADVVEGGNVAYVVGAHLKVMLEEDYMALNKHTVILSEAKDLSRINSIRDSSVSPQNDAHALASQIIRHIILPQIEKEVNTGKNFAPLRQMFYLMILASWCKMALKDAILTQIYGNKSKVKGLSFPNASIGNPQYIYQQYLKAYKKGVFNYIKEDINVSTQQPIPRKYFSGGTSFKNLASSAMLHRVHTPEGINHSDHAVLATVTVSDVSTHQGNPVTTMSIDRSSGQPEVVFFDGTRFPLEYVQVVAEYLISSLHDGQVTEELFREKGFPNPARILSALNRELLREGIVERLPLEEVDRIIQQLEVDGILPKRKISAFRSILTTAQDGLELRDHGWIRLGGKFSKSKEIAQKIAKCFIESALGGKFFEGEQGLKTLWIPSNSSDKFFLSLRYGSFSFIGVMGADSSKAVPILLKKLNEGKKRLDAAMKIPQKPRPAPIGEPRDLTRVDRTSGIPEVVFPDGARIPFKTVRGVADVLITSLELGIITRESFEKLGLSNYEDITLELEYLGFLRVGWIGDKNPRGGIVTNGYKLQPYAEYLIRQRPSDRKVPRAHIYHFVNYLEKAQNILRVVKHGGNIVVPLGQRFKPGELPAVESFIASAVNGEFKDTGSGVRSLKVSLRGTEFTISEKRGSLLFEGFNSSDPVKALLELKKVLKKKRGSLDNAALATPAKTATAARNPFSQLDGGIDLTRSHMHMNVHKEGQGVQMQFNSAMVTRIKRDGFDGLNFQIQSIIPVTNLPQLLGLKASEGY